MSEKFKWINGLRNLFTSKEEKELPSLDSKELSQKVEKTLKEAKETNHLLQQTKQINDFEFLKEKISFLEEKLNKNIEITRKLIGTVVEVTEHTQESSKEQTNDNIPLAKLYDSRLQKNDFQLQELNKKYDAILDILAEKFSNNESLPNLFVGDVSLRELWRKYPNHKDVLLYSIAYMMKKDFEEKGVKIR